ncbi:hypothetical protein [Arenimonas daejeonensis]|uniref:hypothetical protein n=1 Tax=Arenimonas daejeonensis TaxID=370777 RepID=UPI0011BE9BE9|nr:hypothetical protein [Arenimonas daejeonensis]
MPAADRFATLLEPLKVRLARSPLPAWTNEAVQALLSLLPVRWREGIEGDEQKLCVLRRDDHLELIAATRRGDQVLGPLPLHDAGVLQAAHARLEAAAVPVWLLLPASQVLRRTLSLPAAAEPRLREVLAFELDRQTPFSADQVSYSGPGAVA